MRKRKLGNNNLEVSEIGLGCMSMSGAYGLVVDTAQIYGPFANEELVLVGEPLARFVAR
jgi:aryl-alcohol dehydrogenase-like predicted oxidoreductase